MLACKHCGNTFDPPQEALGGHQGGPRRPCCRCPPSRPRRGSSWACCARTCEACRSQGCSQA
eukprot:1534763-Pyramimonas_sp.AAC.1